MTNHFLQNEDQEIATSSKDTVHQIPTLKDASFLYCPSIGKLLDKLQLGDLAPFLYRDIPAGSDSK